MENYDLNELATCGECGIEGPLDDIQNHFLAHFSVNQTNTDCEVGPEDSDNVEADQKLWPSSTIILLIRLVEKHYDSFNGTLKKVVWQKICNELSDTTNKKYSSDQVNTKWKGLKRTYKKIKDHNTSTGKNRKIWQFYDIMDEFLRKKPEIESPATCSSSNGLHLNVDSDSNTSTPSTDRKRKLDNVEKRHREKMQRLDRFLDLYQLSVEHMIGKKVEDKREHED